MWVCFIYFVKSEDLTLHLAYTVSLANELKLLEMAIISLMTGILLIVARNIYQDIDGKISTIAIRSCFA